MTNTIEINTTPEQVWEVPGDLAVTPEWLPGTVTAQVDATPGSA